MKNKYRILLSSIIVTAVFFLVSSCKKEDNIEPNYGSKSIEKAMFNPDKVYDTLTDKDGNIYKTINIGTQIWMAENLRTTHYQNGEDIPEITGDSNWVKTRKGAFCNYNNTKNKDTIETYGRLYNWYTLLDSRKITPNGWHVANEYDWKILIDYLGGDNIAGRKLKETDTIHWCSNIPGTINESGFTALPAGYRSYSGKFMKIGYQCGWWDTTEFNSSNAWGRGLVSDRDNVLSNYGNKLGGYSVRFVKD